MVSGISGVFYKATLEWEDERRNRKFIIYSINKLGAAPSRKNLSATDVVSEYSGFHCGQDGEGSAVEEQPQTKYSSCQLTSSSLRDHTPLDEEAFSNGRAMYFSGYPASAQHRRYVSSLY